MIRARSMSRQASVWIAFFAMLATLSVLSLAAQSTPASFSTPLGRISFAARCAPNVAETPETLVRLPIVSASDARAVLLSAARYLHINQCYHEYKFDPSTIQVAQRELKLDAYNGKTLIHLSLPLTDGKSFLAGCSSYYCYLYLGQDAKDVVVAGGPAKADGLSLNFGSHGVGKFFPSKLCEGVNDPAQCKDAASRFAAALNALARSSSLANFNAESFHQRVAAWRALTVKPPLSNEVQTRLLLAEDAVKSNQPEEALRFYDEGVGLDPTWAQGWFNAALVAAQLNLYSDAILYMQNYLEVTPDAADAASAGDQIKVWKYKAQHSQ
jgi:tetratricopeptide (TPR) repeat protein